MRKDLEMPPGKLAAQAAHACAQSLMHFLANNPDRLPDFIDAGSSGSRIILGAKNLSQIERAFERAREAGLPCALFVDRDHVLPPHFTGAPIITGLGIGPCLKTEARAITRRFSCL